MGTNGRCILLAVGVIGTLALGPGEAGAALRTVSVWPGDLKAPAQAPAYTQQPNLVHADYTDGGSGFGVTFSKQLRLPAGARLRAVTLLYSGSGACGPGGILFNAEVNRYGFGGPMEQLLSFGGSADTGNVVTTGTSSTPIPTDPRDLVVRRGYRYYVEAYSQNVCSKIHGIRVQYNSP